MKFKYFKFVKYIFIIFLNFIKFWKFIFLCIHGVPIQFHLHASLRPPPHLHPTHTSQNQFPPSPFFSFIIPILNPSNLPQSPFHWFVHDFVVEDWIDVWVFDFWFLVCMMMQSGVRRVCSLVIHIVSLFSIGWEMGTRVTEMHLEE